MDWLVAQKKEFPHAWFRVKDVQEGLRSLGLGEGSVRNAPGQLLKLTQCGDVRIRGVGFWKHYKEFKAK